MVTDDGAVAQITVAEGDVIAKGEVALELDIGRSLAPIHPPLPQWSPT